MSVTTKPGRPVGPRADGLAPVNATSARHISRFEMLSSESGTPAIRRPMPLGRFRGNAILP
jgi:hypothetical protein